LHTIDLATLKTIRGLDLSMPVNERQLVEYNRELDDFIETLPAKSYELTKLFMVRDFEFLRKQLLEMSMVLNRLHAVEATVQLNKLLELLPEENKAEIDTELGKLVAGLSTLSIDLQMAQHHIKNLASIVDTASITDATDTKNVPKAPPKTPTSEPEKPAPAEKKAVLVVDDDPVILNVVKVIVEGAEYKFSGVNSGKTALRYLEKNKPALCILDIEMPEMNGHELAAEIKGKYADIPFMFLTSNSQREHVDAAIKLGARGFFVKPPNEDLIFNTLKQFLS
jgi:CheY-like chemotaxis protein